MGREIKRVPLDFQWPKDVVWGGYLNPFTYQCTDCPSCKGSGATEAYKTLEAKWYGNAPFTPEERGSVPWQPTDEPILRFAQRNLESAPSCGEKALQREAQRLCNLFNGQWSYHLGERDVEALLAETRLMDLTHTWTKETGWQAKVPAVRPTARQVNEWSLNSLGHDSINCWVVCAAEAKRLGIESSCKHCAGEGRIWPTEKIKRQHARWRKVEPPKGDGWQLWETVSEGAPISPVFATPEELAEWLVSSPDYQWAQNDAGTSKEQWLAFIRGPGWAPSFVAVDGVLKSGVEMMEG